MKIYDHFGLMFFPSFQIEHICSAFPQSPAFPIVTPDLPPSFVLLQTFDFDTTDARKQVNAHDWKDDMNDNKVIATWQGQLC